MSWQYRAGSHQQSNPSSINSIGPGTLFYRLLHRVIMNSSQRAPMLTTKGIKNDKDNMVVPQQLYQSLLALLILWTNEWNYWMKGNKEGDYLLTSGGFFMSLQDKIHWNNSERTTYCLVHCHSVNDLLLQSKSKWLLNVLTKKCFAEKGRSMKFRMWWGSVRY